MINYIAEQPTSLKLNKYLPGVNLPILNNEILFKEQPDYVLILAWHLHKPIIKSLKSRGLKSKFIVPLPQPKNHLMNDIIKSDCIEIYDEYKRYLKKLAGKKF